jgi:HEPN domain-containing protein
MEQKRIDNVDNVIQAWIKSSDNNFDEMLDFYSIKRYNWALFIGHLCIEKLLKAYYIKIHHKHSMNLHNLIRIAEMANLELTQVTKGRFCHDYNI